MVIAEAPTRAALVAALLLLAGATVLLKSPLLIACSYLALAEAGFAVFFAVKQKRLDAVKTDPGAEHDAIGLMRKCIARITYSDDYLSSWFNGTPREQIHKQNLREFMAYGFWFKPYAELSQHDKEFMEQALKQLEQQTGVVLPEGRNPDIQFLSHLWDPLKVSYKPMIFYVGAEVLAQATMCILQLAGFKKHQHNGNVFYTYGVDTAAFAVCGDGDAPLLFVHGVGAGLLPYLLFIYKLMRKGRVLILPEYKHISMRYTSQIPSVQDCAQAASDFLDSLSIRSVHVMGHSYGTLVCARFAILFADKVASLALMDPVCFAMYMPRLIRTFLYAKSPESGNWLLDCALQMVARELHCAATFCRQFMWNDYNLWPERLPAKTLVALSGGDVLCPAEDVKQYLEEDTAARVLYHPTLHHGAVLLSPGYADLVIKSWQQMLLDPAPPAVVAAADWHEPKPEEVHLHGTAAPAEEDQQADVASVILLDQDAGASLLQQQKLSKKQHQWQEQWRQQWRDLQQRDSNAAADLLSPSNKAAVVPAAARQSAAVSGGEQLESAGVEGSVHQRGVSECPTNVSGEVGPLSDLPEESSVLSDSPSIVSWASSVDGSDGSEGCGSVHCEQCGSLISMQLRGCSSQQSWVCADELHTPLQALQATQQVTPGLVLQKDPASSSCGQEEMAVSCDNCCQEKWQQQVVQAMCA